MPDQIPAPRHWGCVLTAMVTPFGRDGRVDLDAARSLARWLAGQGSDGLVVAATTGEATVLTDGERLDLIRAVSEAVTVPVVAGTGSNDTQHSVMLTRQAEGVGAAGVIAVSPYYSRPPQAGIEAHFRAIAEATALPVMLYDVPVRTGRRVAQPVLLCLFREVANIVALKDATGDPAAAASLLAKADFDLYSGDDAFTLPLLAVGAVGVVGTTTHWTAPLFASMISAVRRGDLVQARAINARLQSSFAYVNSDECVFPMAIKSLLPLLGVDAGVCRLPLPDAPAGTRERAHAVCSELGLVRASPESGQGEMNPEPDRSVLG